MTLQELIKAKPDGFTLDLKTKELVMPRDGYFVSLTNYSTDDLGDCDKIVKAYSFVIKNLGRKGYIGGWSPDTPDNNLYFVDISVHIPVSSTHITDAKNLARMFNQHSIFDCESNKSIEIY